MRKYSNLVEDLVVWLREKVKAAGANGLIFGLSGGIDSAVMAGLAKKAFPDTSLGLIMPCHSDERDEKDAILVAENLDLRTLKVDLTKTFDVLLDSCDLDIENKLAKSNIKPRLRMTTLYYYGQSLNYLVAGPTNKSEFVTGYYTKHGDSGVDMLPLVDFVKSEIYELAEELEIPENIISKIPSAGLWKDQSDEEEMGFTYESLEKYIKGEELEEDLKEKIDVMYMRSEHKRIYPPKYEYK